MAESIPRYTSTAEGFRDAKELAALRPVRENAPRSRKPRVLREVTSGIVCFCGERFGEGDALEFMLHLRAEVGEVLEWREHQRRRRQRQDKNRRQTDTHREAERERDRNRRLDPEYRARKAEGQRAHRRSLDPQQRAEYRERQREYARAWRARKKAEREAAVQ